MLCPRTILVISWTAVFHLGRPEAYAPDLPTTSPNTPPQRNGVGRYRPSFAICPGCRCAAKLSESSTNQHQQHRSRRHRSNVHQIPSSKPCPVPSSAWVGQTLTPDTATREPSLVLTMAGDDRGVAEPDDAGGLAAAAATEDDKEKGNVKVPMVSWVSLAMLLLVYVSNQWTRSLVYYVQNFDVATSEATAKEFMNVALGFDETQYGLLASFSFTLLFSTCSLIAGRAVDVVSRKTATVASCLVWSTMAAGTAFANGFPSVFGLRVLQGSAQAFTTPAAYTMISDLFPASARGTANAIYSSGVYLGGALASLSLLLNGAIGWRESHLVVALVGFAIALLSALLIREPERELPADVGEKGAVSKGDDAAELDLLSPTAALIDSAVKDGEIGEGEREMDDVAAEEAVALLAGGAEAEERESFRQALGIVFESNTVKLLFAATAFRFCAGFGIGVWCAPFFRGRFPSFTSEFSVFNAFVVAGGGLLSSFLGGVISDKYSPEDPRVRAWVPMVGSLLAVPCWMGVVSGTNFYVSLGFLLAEYIVAECWFGPTVTILQEGLPPNVRGVGQGVFSTLSAFGTLAPPLMGALIQRGDFEQQDVLLWTVGAFYAISAAFFFLVGESVLADREREGKLKQA